MNILIWIVFGAIAGWVASTLMASAHGLIEDVILGIVGAFVGGYVMSFLGHGGVTGFNLYSFVVAIIGAAILIFLGRLLHH